MRPVTLYARDGNILGSASVPDAPRDLQADVLIQGNRVFQLANAIDFEHPTGPLQDQSGALIYREALYVRI